MHPGRPPGARRSRCGQLGRVGLGPLHPQVQGAQPAQRQPGLEGAGDRAHRAAELDQPAGQVDVARDRDTEQRRRRGRRGTSSRCARRRRPRSPAAAAGSVSRRCCRPTRQRSRRGRPSSERLEVDQLEHRVGRRLDPDAGRRPAAASAAASASVRSTRRTVSRPRSSSRCSSSRRAVVGVRRGHHDRRPAAPGRGRPRPRAIPEANEVATPPSRAPIALSNISQVGLPYAAVPDLPAGVVGRGQHDRRVHRPVRAGGAGRPAETADGCRGQRRVRLGAACAASIPVRTCRR